MAIRVVQMCFIRGFPMGGDMTYDVGRYWDQHCPLPASICY